MTFLLSLIGKFPWLGTFAGFVSTKGRLIIEYILIAAVVTMAGAMLALWSVKKHTDAKLETVQQRVTVLESENQRQETTIAYLKELRRKDAQALDGLMQDYRILAERDHKVRDRLKELERSNESVRNYLNRPLPAELKCLLNNTCSGAPGDGNRQPGTAPIPNGAMSKAFAKRNLGHT